MREWHKPTVEETESGMEVTSYLPAELDRVLSVLIHPRKLEQLVFLSGFLNVVSTQLS